MGLPALAALTAPGWLFHFLAFEFGLARTDQLVIPKVTLDLRLLEAHVLRLLLGPAIVLGIWPTPMLELFIAAVLEVLNGGRAVGPGGTAPPPAHRPRPPRSAARRRR